MVVKTEEKTTLDVSLFLGVVGKSLRNEILEFFIEGRELDYPIKFVAEELEINRNTLYKVIGELISSKILVVSRKIGSSTFYRLNMQNGVVLDLVGIFDKAINIKMEEYIEKEESDIRPSCWKEPQPIFKTDYKHHYLQVNHQNFKEETMYKSKKEVAVA
jgi:hypothetical protein